MIRWFRSIASTSRPDDPAGTARGFGAERDPARLVFFSDAVFAIAVTLLVLEIRPPQDTRHLLHALAALWPSYLAYAISFLLIGQVWANHHVMFDHIRSADRTVLFLNTLLLMDIAFLPFAAAVLSAAFGTGHGQRTAVVVYGITFEVAAILFNAIWGYAPSSPAARHHHRCRGGQRHQPALPARAGLERHRDPAGRPAPRPRHGRDRRVHPLLLAADPRRDRLRQAWTRRPPSGVTQRDAWPRPLALQLAGS
jgi:uncharacterized membrane protein